MKNKISIILITIGIILITLSILLFIYNKYNANKTTIESQRILNIIEDKINNQKENTIIIDNNEYLGIIYIPSLNIELPVMSNYSYNNLKISPTRYYGEIESNDLVICAHSYKNIFGRIKDLVKGDILILKDLNNNLYVYEVQVIEVLKPENIKEMIESPFDLTLFTCTNGSNNRVAVRFIKL